MFSFVSIHQWYFKAHISSFKCQEMVGRIYFHWYYQTRKMFRKEAANVSEEGSQHGRVRDENDDTEWHNEKLWDRS